MPRSRTATGYRADEVRNVATFMSYVVNSVFGSQMALSRATGLSQPTINGIISGAAGPGHKSIRAVASVTGVSPEEILSGVALVKLSARGKNAADGIAQRERMRAIRALSELYDMPYSEVSELFDDLGVRLPAEVPATTWFDVGRAAIERKNAGLALAVHAFEL